MNVMSSWTLSKLFFISGYALVAVFSSTALAVDIELIRSYQGAAEEISALRFLDAERLAAADRHSGTLIIYAGDAAVQKIALAGGKPFQSPDISGLAYTPAGQYIVASVSDAKIAILDNKVKLQAVFGESGSRAGMLDEPAALDYSINNRIYVADSAAARISVFSQTGVFLFSVGNTHTDPAQRLKKPKQIAVDQQERIHVLETGSSPTLSIYDHAGSLLKRISDTQFKAALKTKPDLVALAVDSNGRLFLADRESGKIFQYDWEKNTLPVSFGSKGHGPGQYLEITALAVADGKLAVADSRNHKIDLYKIPVDSSKPAKRIWLASVGTPTAAPVACTSAYLLNDLNILCLNSKNSRIQIIDPEGKVITNFAGAIKNPTQASYDRERIAVLDKNKVMVFSLNGKLITEFGRSGSSEGQFDHPEDIYLRDNKIYVAESGSRRIQVFSANGVFLSSQSGTPGSASTFSSPVAVAVDTNGNHYIADESKNKIMVFSASKTLLYEIGAPLGSPESFSKIIDLALDSDNNLYVLASTPLNPQTIQIYSGSKRIFEFGSTAGLIQGSSLSVSLADKTMVSVFDVGNRKAPALINFPYLQVPPAAGEIEVEGDVDQVMLRWQKPVGSYIKQYKIYGAVTETGPYTLLKQTADNIITLSDTETHDSNFYKISNVSGFEIEGPVSASKQNIFKKAWQAYQEKAYAQVFEWLQPQFERSSNQSSAVLKLLGLAALAQNQFESALKYFQSLASLKGHEAEGLNLKISVLFESKQYAEAMQHVQKVIKMSDNKLESYLNCGRLSLKIDDPVGAVDCLEKAQKLDAQHAEAGMLLGEAYVRIGATEKGLAEIEKAIPLAGQDVTILQKSAKIYSELGKPELAKQQYKKVLELDSTHTPAQLGLAEILLQLNEFAEAKNIALSLAGQATAAATGHYLLGRIALHNQDAGEAVLEFGKAAREDPKLNDVWLALADAYAILKQPDKVKQALESAITNQKDSLMVLKRLGLLYATEEQHARAAELLQHAAQLGPNDSAVLMGAAAALLQLKRYADAADYARKALELEKNNTDTSLLLAQISRQSGKTGAAIDYAKTALAGNPEHPDISLLLGELYLENNLYDDAEKNLEKAALANKVSDKSHLLLGQLYIKRRLFDKAIKSFETAVLLNGSAENHFRLDTAFAEKKNSLEIGSNTAALVLEDLKVNAVFSAAYKQYTNKSIGSVKIRNAGASTYQNLTLTFDIKGFMDFPVTHKLAKLNGNATEEIPLIAAFNNKVLDIDEDTGVQIEVKLSYTSEGHSDSISATQPMTIYGKNAIVWNNSNMIGSFVTPKDDALRDFVRRIVTEYKPEKGPVNEPLLTAMTLFDTYAAYGIKYQIDPNNPYSDTKGEQVDYVQFARETLKLKSGDCDDLSVLLSASLENMGIETAIVDVPGHLFILFNTTIPAEQRSILSGEDELLVIHAGQVWIPVEATMIATNFMEAWAEGANKYHTNANKGALKTIFLKSAWQEYPPVTLAKVDSELTLPEKTSVETLIAKEQKSLLEKSLARLVMPYEAMLKNNPDDHSARMQIAITYARYGLYEKSIAEFNALTGINASRSAAYNNLGNIYFAKGELQHAIEAYQQAEKQDASDGGIKLNLAMSYYKEGKTQQAKEKLNEAIKLDRRNGDKYAAFGKLLNQ